MLVRDVMSNRTLSLSHDSSVLEAAEMLSKHNIGAVPVVFKGELCGMLTDRDIVLRCVAGGCDARQMRVGEIMSSRIVTVSPEDTLDTAMNRMADAQIRRLPVVESGKLVGILSLADVARANTGMKLAETVTEISMA